jgi:hypothetical protein
MSEDIKITLKIIGECQEDSELMDTYSRRLREELLELDVDSVEPSSITDAPKGSKGLGLASVGEMVLSMAPLDYAVSSVVGAVRSFAGRNQCNVRVDIGSSSIEIQGTSDDDQRKLVDAFINSVSK